MVKLIAEGRLAAETPGKRRRMVKLEDLLAYRAKRRDQQYRALVETAGDLDSELDEDPAVMAQQFRRIRAEVAAGRAKGKV